MNAGAILLVEDNPITRKMLRVSLEVEGYDVHDAPDGRTALELASARSPDLLILDFVLPDMDGLQLLMAIRLRLGRPDLPVVLITGMISQLEELRARAGGSTQVLGKPIEPSQLLEVVRAQLAPTDGRGGGQRILVVDDEPLNLKLAMFRLKRGGYDVETASSGEAALAVVRRRRPDAILTDVMMPSMDGFTLCRELRRVPTLATVPIILVSSAYVDEADRELARQMGASALVVRTPDLRDALLAVESSLRGTSGAPPVPTRQDVSVLHRERLQVQLERQTARNETLVRQAAIQATALSIVRGLSEVLSQPREVPQILGDVLVHCLDAAGLSTGLLYVTGPRGHRLQAQFGIPAERKADAEAVFGHPELMDRIIQSGKPVALSAAGEGTDAETSDFLARLGYPSVLILPFVVLGETFGELVLASESHDLSDGSWIAFARNLALQFGQTVALGQALSRLTASESRYRALMEQANDAILILNPAAEVLELNREAERLLGRSREALIGLRYDDLVAQDETAESARLHEQLLDNGTLRVQNRHLVRIDGTRVSVEVSAALVKLGDESVVLTILRDITERNEAERRLQESEEQYRLLFDSNPYPMWVFDVESLAFLAVNDAAVRHYGWTREEFLGMRITDIRPPETILALMTDIEAVRSDVASSSRPGVWRHRKKDGTEIDAEVVASAITFQGRAARLTLAADVTDRTLLQTQLVRSQKMEAVGQLAGGVAHDFNNLLGVITGYSELLISTLPVGSRERRRGEEIKAAADRAATLTRQLLAFSRRQVLQPTVLDLGIVVADVAKMLRRVISEDIQIAIESATGPTTVRADAGQVEQVIMNLAVNARDAMPFGGRLVIETANVTLDDTYVRSAPGARPGDFARLSVADTGHGMDAITVARIFEPFFTTKDEGKGTGLGLATVYGIVQQSGGWINVYSEPGQGTTFKVYLPLVPADVETGARAEVEPAPGGGETILVVEDAEALRLLVHELLENAGYTVLEAEGPEKALAVAQSTPGPIHVVLTDMVMPRMSGLELAAKLAIVKPDARLVLMSGYSEQVFGERGNLPPGSLFLQKPFTMDALKRIIREAVNRPRDS